MSYFPNTISIEQEYTSAQTNTIIVTVGATQRIAVTRAGVSVDEAVTVNGVGFRIGCGISSTGIDVGVVLSHAGLMPGDKWSEGNGGGVLHEGNLNESLHISCENPVGGALRVVVSYFVIETT